MSVVTVASDHIKYRPDIDGLRTIAVLPVVLNHMGMRGVWGGYIGVDIFFVISGFLITSNIVSAARAGQYSIADFYRRRILRIFPALFVVLAVCSLITCVVMLPTELIRYARSLAAATFFSSNMLFYAEAGYFEPAARLKPLLHTWSLAIEEQFYILWPLMVAPIARYRPQNLPLLAGLVTVVSFVASVWMVSNNPSAAYYLLPSRAWELSIGALLATVPHRRLPAWLSEIFATVGIAAIIIAIRRLDEASAFPGVLALLPCGGAALLILTGSSGSWVAKVLSLRPVVFIGRISYPLYLWHWPVIVFFSIGLFLPPSPWVMAVELALSILLATLSTFYIERPFRTNAGGWTTRAVLTGGLIAMMVSLAVAGALIAAKGLPQRFTPAQQSVAAYEALDGDALYRRGTCFAVGPRMPFDEKTCLAHDRPLPGILLLGDSHAAHLWPGLSRYQDRFNVMQATHTGCKPLLYPASADPCRQFFRTMLSDRIRKLRPDITLLAARWRPDDLPLLAQTLADPAVLAAHPILIGPVPQYSSGLPRLLVFGEIRGDAQLVFRSQDPQVVQTDREMAALAQRMGVPYVSMLKLMCDAKTCLVWAAPNVPMQFDYGHFTQLGSIKALDMLMPRIMNIANADHLHAINP